MKRMTAVDKTTETQAVVNLTCIKFAAEEDKVYLVDYWAAMFKAKTASDKEVARLRALLSKHGILEE